MLTQSNISFLRELSEGTGSIGLYHLDKFDFFIKTHHHSKLLTMLFEENYIKVKESVLTNTVFAIDNKPFYKCIVMPTLKGRFILFLNKKGLYGIYP